MFLLWGKTHSNVRSVLRRDLALETAWSQQRAEGHWASAFVSLDPTISSLGYMVQREQVVPGDNSQLLNSHQMPSISQVLTRYF